MRQTFGPGTGSSGTLIGWSIWSNHLCPSMGPNGKSVAMDSEESRVGLCCVYNTIHCCIAKKNIYIKEEYLRVNGPGSGTQARGKEEDVEAEGNYNQRTIICKQN